MPGPCHIGDDARSCIPPSRLRAAASKDLPPRTSCISASPRSAVHGADRGNSTALRSSVTTLLLVPDKARVPGGTAVALAEERHQPPPGRGRDCWFVARRRTQPWAAAPAGGRPIAEVSTGHNRPGLMAQLSWERPSASVPARCSALPSQASVSHSSRAESDLVPRRGPPRSPVEIGMVCSRSAEIASALRMSACRRLLACVLWRLLRRELADLDCRVAPTRTLAVRGVTLWLPATVRPRSIVVLRRPRGEDELVEMRESPYEAEDVLRESPDRRSHEARRDRSFVEAGVCLTEDLFAWKPRRERPGRGPARYQRGALGRRARVIVVSCPGGAPWCWWREAGHVWARKASPAFVLPTLRCHTFDRDGSVPSSRHAPLSRPSA
jgi:hypothetical protein